MLHLIPAPAHRAGLRLAHAIRKHWWRIRRPQLAGCRVLALDGEGRVLLVRHSYGPDRWMPPGGGLARGEDALTASLRELREETACALDGAHLLELVEERLHGAGNMVHVVAGWTVDAPRADGREIVEAGFFALDALPANMAPLLRAQLPEWVRAATAGRLRDGTAPHSPPPAPRA